MRRLKRFATAMITGILLVGSVGVFAAQTYQLALDKHEVVEGCHLSRNERWHLS